MKHFHLVSNASSWNDSNGTEHVVLSSTSGEKQQWTHNQAKKAKGSIEHFLPNRETEIVVMLEDTDKFTGATVQARHSYRVDDISWKYTFANCIQPFGQHQDIPSEGGWIPRHCERRVSDPICTVNFTKFHRLVSVSPDELNRPNIFQDNFRSTVTKCRWNIPKIDRSSSHHYSTLRCHLLLGIVSESLLVVFSFTAIFFWFHVIHTDSTYWFGFRVSVTQ
jgi:Inward rectifier potassium channel C-terminal domain